MRAATHTWRFPVTVAAVGVLIAPLLAALGAISALVAKFTIVVVRNEPKAPPPAAADGEKSENE